MTTFLIIGNIISLFGAVFTVLSALSTTRRRIYGYQTIQCLILAFGSIFFESYSGVVTFLICTVRNFELARDTFSNKKFILCSALMVVLGAAVNTKGLLGLVPVIATLVYNIGCVKCRRELPIKTNMFINLALWSAYDFVILDLVSAIIDSVTTAVTLAAMLRLIRANRSGKKNRC